MFNTKNISIKGILFGIGFNVIASIILSITVAVIFSSVTGLSIKNPDKYQEAFESSFDVRLSFLLGGLLIAFGMGYVAEKFAAIPSIINASICGALLLIYTITFVFIRPEAAPIWSQIAIIIGVIPLSIFGGWLYARNKTT